MLSESIMRPVAYACGHAGRVPSYVPEVQRAVLHSIPESGWAEYEAARPLHPPLDPTLLAIVSKRLSQVLTVALALQKFYTQQVGRGACAVR